MTSLVAAAICCSLMAGDEFDPIPLYWFLQIVAAIGFASSRFNKDKLIRNQIPTLLMQLDRAYNRYTSFGRGRGAFGRIFRWGAEHCGFHSPVFRLSSGVAFEYSPLVNLDLLTRDLLIRDVFEPDQTMTLRKLLSEGGVFFDVGANLGYFSILAATW